VNVGALTVITSAIDQHRFVGNGGIENCEGTLDEPPCGHCNIPGSLVVVPYFHDFPIVNFPAISIR
jgi:hypothetical protein